MGKLTEALKKAIRDSEASLYRISQDSGVDHTALTKFIRDQSDLMLVNADRLAGYFGLILMSEDTSKATKAAPKASTKAASKPAAKAVRRLSL